MIFFPLLLIPAAYASYIDHEFTRRAFPDKVWYQPRDHPVQNLFKRGGDDATYQPVGSPAWASAYPVGTPDTSSLPKAWVDALNAAVAAGKIPDIPLSKSTSGSIPTYPSGFDPESREVCSSTYQCRIEGQIWDAPDGCFGASFDDGPLPSTDNFRLFNLDSGENILNHPDQFLTAFNAGHDIAVHTWAHPYMTSLSNLEIVAQLGWTMEIIHNSTAYRPPMGDSDRRVEAIAKVVFDLTTILWNHDTNDWSLTVNGGTTPQAIATSMDRWLTGPKSPGLIILEHELTDMVVNTFIEAYPKIQANGWKIISVAQMLDGNAYRSDSASADTNLVLLNSSSNSTSLTSTTSSSPSPASLKSESSGALQILSRNHWHIFLLFLPIIIILSL
ncbi:carbohydrate esterase family 4 protein [Mycena floridula]|nr:carbohydrate esterase family 4 protein [Mycena floridula]